MKLLGQLKMLFSLRAWWRSTALKAGGIVGILGAIQTYLGTKDGTDIVALVAGFLHLMPGTLGGILAMLVGLLIWVLRAKSEWSLKEIATGADQITQGRRSTDTPPKDEAGFANLVLLYTLAMILVYVAMAFVVR